MWRRYSAKNPTLPVAEAPEYPTPWVTHEGAGKKVALLVNGQIEPNVSLAPNGCVVRLHLSPEDALHLARELIFFAGWVSDNQKDTKP